MRDSMQYIGSVVLSSWNLFKYKSEWRGLFKNTSLAGLIHQHRDGTMENLVVLKRDATLIGVFTMCHWISFDAS